MQDFKIHRIQQRTDKTGRCTVAIGTIKMIMRRGKKKRSELGSTNRNDIHKRRFPSILQAYQWELHLLLKKKTATFPQTKIESVLETSTYPLCNAVHYWKILKVKTHSEISAIIELPRNVSYGFSINLPIRTVLFHHLIALIKPWFLSNLVSRWRETLSCRHYFSCFTYTLYFSFLYFSYLVLQLAVGDSCSSPEFSVLKLSWSGTNHILLWLSASLLHPLSVWKLPSHFQPGIKKADLGLQRELMFHISHHRFLSRMWFITI